MTVRKTIEKLSQVQCTSAADGYSVNNLVSKVCQKVLKALKAEASEENKQGHLGKTLPE
ncbi:hypothetical protein BC830DRAFT_1175218 [Chytriomyces sp. MP71]|nr:hypothetical protein BC830DRAFT_1175218 [Chytriomyces sp. MP71]